MSKHPATTFEEQPASIHIGTPADAEPSGTSVPGTPGYLIPESDRYSRQVLFPGIGEAGQRNLARAHIALVGCGATGAAAAARRSFAARGQGQITPCTRCCRKAPT